MDKDTIRDYELDIIVKAWRDEKFRKNLLKNPKLAIEQEFSVKVPLDMNVFVHEESDQSLHLIVPSKPANFDADELTDSELKDVIGGVISQSGRLSLPNIKERTKLRDLQKENNQLRKLIDKLKQDLDHLQKKSDLH